MFLHVSVILFTGRGFGLRPGGSVSWRGLCPGGSLSGGSLSRGSLLRGLCLGCLCPV